MDCRSFLEAFIWHKCALTELLFCLDLVVYVSHFLLEFGVAVETVY